MSDDEILAATYRVVGREGLARLTLARVADEVGLSPAGLIQRFGSKDELLRAAAASGGRQVDETFDAARVADPLESLVAGLVAFAGGVGSREELANHLGMLQLDVSDPELRAAAREQAERLRRRLADLLDEARAADQLEDVEVGALATSLWTVYNGALVTWAVEGDVPLDAWLRDRLEVTLAPHRR